MCTRSACKHIVYEVALPLIEVINDDNSNGYYYNREIEN